MEKNSVGDNIVLCNHDLNTFVCVGVGGGGIVDKPKKVDRYIL